jgi:AraC-like DNA-binding protein
MTDLLEAVRRHADTHAGSDGIAVTPVPRLTTVRALAPSELLHAISRPLVALVVQGSKRVTMGSQTFAFSAGESLLISADVPTVSQITRASAAAPYYSVALELDASIIAELSLQMDGEGASDEAPVRIDATEREVADAALRLLRLFDRPSAASVLQDQLLRELHYWLLVGRHGHAIRQLGLPDGRFQRIARAVALLRKDYASMLPVERLAAAAGMSPSSFHQHFRAVTSLSPLQFQKQLRLIEARRLMLSRGLPPSHAAYEVGYESVPQFTREYGRFYGAPPARDMKAAKDRASLAA